MFYNFQNHFRRWQTWRMGEAEKKFIYEDGVRFEVTSYGLVCCLKESENKKHPCSDCNFCQWCSDSRCSLCRDQRRYDRESKKNET